MKKIILAAIALQALLAAPLARAWSYNDGDLLLVFREGGYNDVEYDLGPVTNFLGHADGYTTNVTGWNPSVATGVFGSDLTGVNVILVAATSPTAANPTIWLSGAEPNTTAYNGSSSLWSSQHSVISALGNKPISPFSVPAAPGSPTNAYSISPSGIDGGASYDFIVSGGRFTGIPALGGNAPFTVQQTIPGSLDFWATQPTSIYPHSPPDQLVGTFNITSDGVLTFVAGPRQSTLAGVSRSGNVSAIQFTTTVGNHYSVAYTNQLGAPVSSWPVDNVTLVGDGNIDTLNHTNSGSAEFYEILTQ